MLYYAAILYNMYLSELRLLKKHKNKKARKYHELYSKSMCYILSVYADGVFKFAVYNKTGNFLAPETQFYR